MSGEFSPFPWRCVVLPEQRKVMVQAVGWLLLLTPFFLTYGKVNQFTARQDAQYQNVGVSFLTGSRPFLLFHGPFFLTGVWICFTDYPCLFAPRVSEQRRLVLRLVLASVIACGGFYCFRCSLALRVPK